MNLPETRIRFSGKPLTISISKEMLGRVFNGLGQPIDGGPPQRSDIELNVNGMAIIRRHGNIPGISSRPAFL